MARMKRKWNSCIFLVRMPITASIKENMGVFSKNQ
jgi:hypothetical protein